MTGSVELAELRPADLLRSDSVRMGLLYDMIGRSLTDQYELCRVGRRTFFIPDPALDGKERVFEFQHKDERISGATATEYTMKGQSFIVNEAFSHQLDFHEDTLWFILEPSVVVTSDGRNLAPEERRRVIVNDVVSKRYNREAHERLLFWLYYLSSITDPITFNFPPGDEPGVRFTLDSHFAFSSRGTPGGLRP